MKYLPKVIGFLLIVFSLFFVFPKTTFAQDNAAAAQCIGKGVAGYMNAVVAGAGNLSKIKLLSPAFNLTSKYVPPIFDAMVANQANFAKLAGFAGNTYRVENSISTKSPFDFYVDMGWRNKFTSYGKSVFVTETGNFNGSGDYVQTGKDFTELKAAGEIKSINYFNALGTNPDPAFAYAVIREHYKAVISGDNGKAGINSASFINPAFANTASTYGAKWTVELLNGPNDLAAVIAMLAATPKSVTPILRLCAGNSCGFADPQTLVAFLTSLNARADRIIYVIAGPNEPDAEYWATPNCPKIEAETGGPKTVTTSDKPIPQPYVPGGEIRGNEFHSLRPYQASPFGMLNSYVEQDTLSCGNDIVVKESLDLLPAGGDLPPINCTPTDQQGSLTCTYQVVRSVAKGNAPKIEINLKDSDLPIIGNTQLVPNYINTTNALDAITRVNEYVSWYLNGALFRKEENPESLIQEVNNPSSTTSTVPVTSPSSGDIGKILAIGDSITAGSFAYPYLCPLKEKLQNSETDYVGSQVLGPLSDCGSLHEEGYGGYTTQAILNLSSWKTIKADTAIILLGTNDAGSNVPVATTIGNLKKIVETLKNTDPNIRVVLSQIIPAKNFDVGPLNSEIAKLGQTLNVTTVDQSNLVFDEDYKFPNGTVDAVHPGPSGAKKIADNFYNALVSTPGSTQVAQGGTSGKNNYSLLDFAGPLNKLLPAKILDFQRAETAQAIQYRHNQIYECLVLGKPVSCIGELAGIAQQARLLPEGANGVGAEPPLRESAYLPLAPNEDRAGEVVLPEPQFLNQATTDQMQEPQENGIVVSNVKFFPDPGIVNLNQLKAQGNDHVNPSVTNGQVTPARNDLYFAQMEGTADIARLLQQTYIPEGDPGFSGDAGQGAPYFNTKKITARCEAADAKTNSGDDLFGDYHVKDKGYYTNIKGTVEYSTNVFSVNFPPPTVTTDPECQANCSPTDQACLESCTTASYKPQKRNVWAAMSVYTKTPKLNEIAERLVAGTSGVVQRIFPIDILNSVVNKKDYAAYTEAEYKLATDNNAQGVEVQAGDPIFNRSGKEARIYFPHLGAIQEYFLRGVQCALRPQGFCEPSSVFASTPSQSQQTTIACTINNSGIVSTKLLAVIGKASQWAHVPPQLLITIVKKEAGCSQNSTVAADNFNPALTPICELTDAQITPYLAPNREYERNCGIWDSASQTYTRWGGTDADIDGRAKGPLQFYHEKNSGWAIWRNAINLATGQARTTNLCNIEDSVYAAAWVLSAGYNACPQANYDVSKTPSSMCSNIAQDDSSQACWDTKDMKWSLTRWAAGCSYGYCDPNFTYCPDIDKNSKIVSDCLK